jgi:UDP-xylose/UDP-N-acetylglucosamine transporter B4
MFYLHFLGLFLFLPLLPELKSQISAINHLSPRAEFSVPLPFPPLSFPTLIPPFTSIQTLNLNLTTTFLSFPSPGNSVHLSIPTPYLPLLLNTLTQLLCIAGVHRLTTRVSALTVTLVLVVRKATSLVLSVKGGVLWRVLPRGVTRLFGGLEGVGKKYQDVNGTMLWTGAALVMLGTVGYTLGTAKRTEKTRTKEE